MKARLLALVVCTLPLLALFGLWLFIDSGNFDRLTHGMPLTIKVPTTLEEVHAALGHLRTAASSHRFVAMALAILLILDARALFQRDPQRRGQVPQPADDPMGFMTLRLRRYMFVPFALLCLIVECNAEGTPSQGPAKLWTVVSVILARRGENDTYGTM